MRRAWRDSGVAGASGRDSWPGTPSPASRRPNALDRPVGPGVHGAPLTLTASICRGAAGPGDGGASADWPRERRRDRSSIFKEGFVATGSPLHWCCDALVTIDPRYEWRLLDGVVVIRPQTAWDDPANPLAGARRQPSACWTSRSASWWSIARACARTPTSVGRTFPTTGWCGWICHRARPSTCCARSPAPTASWCGCSRSWSPRTRSSPASGTALVARPGRRQRDSGEVEGYGLRATGYGPNGSDSRPTRFLSRTKGAVQATGRM